MNLRGFSVLLSSLLLLHLLPVYIHGSSLASKDSRFNSSHTNVVGLKPANPGKAEPISSSKVHAQNAHTAEKPGRSELGENSKEQKHQPDMAVGGMGAGLPIMPHGKAQLDFKEDDTATRWPTEILQPDRRVLDLNSPSSSHEKSLFLSKPDDSSPIIKVSFTDPDQLQQIKISPQEVQGDVFTSFPLSSFDDYLSPDYSTTESFVDDWSTPTDMPDENQLVPANSQSLPPDEGASGGDNRAGTAGAVDAVQNGGCLLGFVRQNGSCQSPCDVYTNYCFNGGLCYVVEGTGAFCRCNIQEYVWNKGSRCESIITEFQVMCVVVSGVSITLLVLFMVIVFFSKQLHVLKTQNRQLRKRSKARPQSEQHFDNFSLSTVAEGSQTNVRNVCDSPSNPVHASAYHDNPVRQDDPAKPDKPVKSPMKEDEAQNLQNFLTPKHENTTVSADVQEENGATIDLELLLPNQAKTCHDMSPMLHYDVFLYKLPKSPGRSRQGMVRPRRSSEPGYSPMSFRTPNPRLGKASTP